MASAEETLNEDKNKEFVLKFDVKKVMLPIMRKNKRPMPIAFILLTVHFIEMFSLQIKDHSFPNQKGLMPSIHTVIGYFNLKYLFKEESSKFPVLYMIFIFNLLYVLSVLILGFSRKEKKTGIQNLFVKLHVINFQIFNWIMLVPFCQFSANILFHTQSTIFDKILCAFNILAAAIMSNVIEHAHININFKYEDYLDTRVNFFDRLILNLKILMAITGGIEFYYEFVFLFVLILCLFDYFAKINFYSETISKYYMFILFEFTFLNLVYTCFDQHLFSLDKVDVSFLLFFSCTIFLKLSFLAREFLIVHKLKIITKYGIISKVDFDLFIRENYYNFKNFTKSINSKILFLTFFSLHQNKCKYSECLCREIKMMKESDFRKHKKTFKRVLEFFFVEFLENIKPEDFEEVYLLYCSFILSVLKLPGKALNYLLSKRKQMKQLKNKILLEILVKKCKKALEKRLLNNDQYAQSFSSVVLFDHRIKELESKTKKLLIDLLVTMEIVNDDLDKELKAIDKFVKIGNEVIESLEVCKETIKILLDKNVNNNRLLQLAAMILKYLSEDVNFRNFYKQLNIKRINQKIMRRKKGNDTLDIFDNDAGVVFISLGKTPGQIKRFSKNFPKIFGSDQNEVKKKNISDFMPSVFAKVHDSILLHFVKTGKPAFLITNQNNVFGLTRQNMLMHLSLLTRLDTYFARDFLVGGFVKSLKNAASKTILLDIHGNFINCSREVGNFLDISHLPRELQHKISIVMMIPDIFERLLPNNYEDVLNRKNTHFKMKGFLLAPSDLTEFNANTLMLKEKTYSSFNEFQAEPDADHLYKNLRFSFFEKIKNLPPQDFKFYRIHFTLIIQNFSNNAVNVRLIEIFDIFEVKDMKLQVQYLTRKNNKLAKLLKDEALIDTIDIKNAVSNMKVINSLASDDEKKERSKNFVAIQSPSLQDNKLDNSSPVHSKDLGEENSFDKSPEMANSSIREEEGNDIYISVTHRSNLDQKVNQLNFKQSEGTTLTPASLLIAPNKEARYSTDLNDINNLLSQKQNEKLEKDAKQNSLSTIVNSFDVDSSELSFENNDDFEEKISEISNNKFANQSSEDTLNEASSKTHTYAASAISRVSSHASGDAKKGALNVLMNAGSKKVQFLRGFNTAALAFFLGVTSLFFALNQQETHTLQKTISNSGIFHDQLSPICILVRDNEILRLFYKGYLSANPEREQDLMSEVKSSLIFNYGLLNTAYRNGISRADSSVDFIYSKFLDIQLHKIVLYTIRLQNITQPNQNYIIKNRYFPIEYVKDQLRTVNLNVPQTILFYLAAAQHIYSAEILDRLETTVDSYNYVFFIRENILDFIEVMLGVFEINKNKIVDTVLYLDILNVIFLSIMISFIFVTVVQMSFIGIKTKFKSTKFCTLFFHFNEQELDERIKKLNYIVDRYFNTKNKVFATEITTLSTNKTSEAPKSRQMNILSTDKLFLLRSNKFQKGRRAFKRSNSIRQLRGKSFQNFIFIFMLGVLIFSGIFIAIYTANYIMTKKFSENVIDIMGDMESVETYIISIHIRFSLNSVLMGLTDDDLDRRNIKQQKIKKLIQEIDILQSKITDLTYLFRLTTTSNILTDLKYKFFTADICALISDLKSNHVSGNDEVLDNILGRLKNKAFCESLIKNVLTKGSTSFAFDLNEIFVQWRLFIENNGFSSDSVKEIISSIDFRDINFSLPYVYAIGLYYLREMIRTSNDYFDEIRLNMIIWFIFAILASLAIFLGPLQLLTKYLSIMLFRNIALIRLFPFTMIGNNKMLENKITRMFRLQKI